MTPELIKTLNRLEDSHAYVLVDSNEKILGLGVLLIENKFIHECGKVGHLVELQGEDEIVRSKLTRHLCDCAKELGCYKTILNCAEEQQSFFQQQGFVYKGAMMTIER